MGRWKELYMAKIASQQDDDIHRSIVHDIEERVRSFTEFIDCDDIVGNRIMAYVILNADDIAMTLRGDK